MDHIPIKIIIAGDGGTGKSTLLSVKNTGKFKYSSKITIGVDFMCLMIQNQNKKIPFLIYDLGGQKRFQFLHDSYLNGTKGAIILYDLTRESTFSHIPKWITLLNNEDSTIPIIIAGSKLDLAQPEDIQNSKNKWQKMKLKDPHMRNVFKHVFISSKTYTGVDELFKVLSKKTAHQITISKKIPYI